MQIRAIDSSGDWMFGQGYQSYKYDEDCIEQNIVTKIREWTNDCYFNMTAGIDWYNRLGSINQKTRLDTDIKNLIVQIEGVAELVSYSSTLTNRVYNATYVIKTVFSTTIQNTINSANNII